MNLRHFTIFKEAAETRNFTQAAENLYITQSAVSHAIRELEEEAGTRLFDRLSKNVSLTRSGELLLKEVEPFLNSFEKLEEKVKKLEEDASIHIVSCITIAGFWLPDLLAAFRKIHPKTKVFVEVVSAENALHIAEQGRADLAFIEGNVLPSPFHARRFASYELYLAAGREFLKDRLKLEELLKEPLLLREKGSAIRDTFDSALLLKGYQAEPSWVSVNSQALIEGARAGLGITVLPDVLLKKEFSAGELKRVRVEGLALKNYITALVHKDKYMGRPLKSMWNMVEEMSLLHEQM